MLSDPGEADIVRFAADVTVSVTVAFCWIPPPLPVTVIGYVPTGVLAPTVIVIVELPAPGAGIGSGLKLTVVPDGTPDDDKLTALLKPPPMVVVIVDVPCLPCCTVSEAGEADSAKFGELDACATPRNASGVITPLLVLNPTTTVSRVPASVTCWLTLLAGHFAADQLFPSAS